MTLAGQEAEQLGKLVEAYTADASLGNIDEVLDVSICWRIWVRVQGSTTTNLGFVS